MRKEHKLDHVDQLSSKAPLVRLDQIGKFFKGKGISRSDLSDEGFPCLRYGEIYSTYGNTAVGLKSRVSPKAVASAQVLKTGDIVFAASGETLSEIGKAVAYIGPEPAYVGGDTIILREHQQDSVFLAHALNSEQASRQKARLGKGQSIVHIHAPDLSGVEIYHPPPLRTAQDRRDTADLGRGARKTHRPSRDQKDLLTGITQVLTGRGGVFPDSCDLKPLSAIASRVRRKNDGGDHPVMTISAKSGFLMQSDKFARDMAGSSVDNYTLLHEGEFAYNKGNSLAAKYGCIYQLDRPTAVVPFVYFCFALKSGLDANFYSHLFAAGALNHQLSRLINSGVRNDGLLNLNVEDFFGCKVPVPPIEDQRRIGEALTTAKHELSLLDEEIEALTQQKRGLMQKLLTGEWPVKPEGAVD